MKKIQVKVDTKFKVVSIRRGWFGPWTYYSGGWYEDESIEKIVEDFEKHY